MWATFTATDTFYATVWMRSLSTAIPCRLMAHVARHKQFWPGSGGHPFAMRSEQAPRHVRLDSYATYATHVTVLVLNM